ncbi:HsdM family class I SAM-dependent methyltransferase [Limnoglobus roseus]|uniref:Site-specific DNA-methyltransferase n=1 Tax=Limnoglobus roseus TaxID=2598579 RepID=A0A5C1AKG2_9BACT|nr:N-6 DNA methylase [Limnoglobus roseus]QEL18693.1 site-specific DNA-methyltransferase [Limnoglobus roseus]
MPTTTATDWRQEFGLAGRSSPGFFTAKSEITPSTPQAHLLRRAFDTLDVDGVLCADHSPLVYFRVVKRITPDAILELHHRFWNHGGASLLVLVTDDSVHVYSGMTRPAAGQSDADPAGLVTNLSRVAEGLKEFVVSVESGEFFRQHQRSFDPAQRVDRDLLNNLLDAREKLNAVTRRKNPSEALDALLCRLVFTSYLFDRGIIDESYLTGLGIRGAKDLRELLANPSRSKARDSLYKLFTKLGEDFNGDLFRDDLKEEKAFIQEEHVKILDDFFQETIVRTGQRVLFYRYDFRYIPIETISAIYERFLKDVEKQQGAFYTPRFLAEVVLDTALGGTPSLAGKRFFDPACGSGIFLVGLFNRLAEEWKQANLTARNDRKATELMRLLRESIFGVDISLTACRITAFSLYLAYLDHLAPRDIQALQKKGKALPRLVADGEDVEEQGNIRCADFFDTDQRFPTDVSLVIGNPPWGSIATSDSPAGAYCDKHERPLPDKQIAAAFIWKATDHVAAEGRVCFVLPHGVLFNHSTTAIPFQKAWVATHALERVLNLADYQRFLFERAGHPAVVVCYRKKPPVSQDDRIEYWGPKADWTVTKAEVITIVPQDRTTITVGELLRDLDGPDAPQIWKQRFWATPRDWRLLDRLGLYTRLRENVRRAKERNSSKPWIMAVGFQPLGDNDDAAKAETITLPSRHFIRATSANLDLFLLERDCQELEAARVTVRSGSNKLTDVFRGPHVLMAKGMTSTAFAAFHVSFQDAVRGIHGPEADRDMLVFAAAYLRSPLALYYLFHTSSNWGISRQEAHVEEVLRLPFPLPHQLPDPKRARQIVSEVAKIVDAAALEADTDLVDRAGIVRSASLKVEPLIEEYLDVLPHEKFLIEDTVNVIIESTRPTRARPLVPTVTPANAAFRQTYIERVCETLNGWAKSGQFAVRGQVQASETLGVGVAVLEKVKRAAMAEPMPQMGTDLLHTLDAVRKAIPRQHATLDIVRGVMVFDQNRLYIVKPIGQRFWTQTAALNDADEIAGTILMQSPRGDA